VTLVPTFCWWREPRIQRDGSPRLYSRLSRPDDNFSSKKLISCTHEAEWAPSQTHYFSENLVAPGIELGPLDLLPGFWPLDHRGDHYYYIIIICVVLQRALSMFQGHTSLIRHSISFRPGKYIWNKTKFSVCIMSSGSTVGIATGYELDNRGIGVRVPVGSRTYTSLYRRDWLWGPPSLLSNEHLLILPLLAVVQSQQTTIQNTICQHRPCL
jgi:hypothetical protein